MLCRQEFCVQEKRFGSIGMNCDIYQAASEHVELHACGRRCQPAPPPPEVRSHLGAAQADRICHVSRM